MKNTKLTELLNSLSKEESRKFIDFLKSPFFNKSKKILKLDSVLRILKNSYKELEMKIIYEKVFGDEKYNNQKMRSLVSDYVKLLEKFFIQNGILKSHNKFQQTILLEQLMLRNLHKNFDTLKRQLDNYRNIKYHPSGEDYKNFADIENSAFINSYLNRYIYDERCLIMKSTYTDFYFIFSKLHTYNRYIHCYIPFEEKFLVQKPWNINEILQYVENNINEIKSTHIPVYIEYLILKMIISDNSYFYELWGLLRRVYDSLETDYLEYIYSSINQFYIHVCYKKYDIEKDIDLSAISDFYEKKGHFKNIRLIAWSNFYNIVQRKLEAGKINEADYFYKTYNHKIYGNDLDNLRLLTEAIIFKYKNLFGKATEKLGKVNTKNWNVYLLANCYLANIYYDEKDYMNVNYLCEKVLRYLNRNKKKVGLRYYVYYNYFYYLLKIEQNNENKILLALEKKISSTESIANKLWLLSIIKKKVSTK